MSALREAVRSVIDRWDSSEYAASELFEALRAALEQPERTPLSEDEVVGVLGNLRESITSNVFLAFARAIEQAHGIGEKP